MKFSLLLAIVCLVVAGCKRSPPSTPLIPEPAAPVRAADPAASGKPAASGEIASTVRIRVISGGLPVKNYTGSLLQRAQLGITGAAFAKHRCVLLLLKGWSEGQLRSDQTRFLVFRNLPNSQGEPVATSYPAQLAQFDPATGIAMVTYYQGFPAPAGEGFAVSPSPAADDSGLALRFSTPPGPPPPTPAGPDIAGFYAGSSPPISPPLIAATGSYSAARSAPGALKFPPEAAGTVADEAPLVAAATSILKGFLALDERGAATLVPVRPSDAVLQFAGLKPVSVAFRITPQQVVAAVNVEATGSGAKPNRIALSAAELAPDSKLDLAALEEPFEPITHHPQMDWAGGGAAGSNQYTTTLDPPEHDGAERTYLLQLGWTVTNDEATPSVLTRPFAVRLSRKGETITAVTEGIANLSEAKPETPGKSASFTTEAPVISVFEIAGGREVLLQLQGEPFWKRFSMEKKQWLPLPAVNLATVDLAGNLSSLFLLDRTAGEVRKYALSNLQLAATARIENHGEQFSAVRTGCDSGRGPVLLISNRGPIALDPETLRRRDFPVHNPLGANPRMPDAHFRTTGDGLTLMAEPGVYFGSVTYAGDYLGCTPMYFDVYEQTHSSIAVSAAFSYEHGFATCANPEGTWVKTPGPPPSFRPDSQDCLFPSAPVLVRYVEGDPRPIPAVPPRIRCYGLFDAEPFAQLDLPETAGNDTNYGRELLSKYRLGFDPYSRRLGFLAPDQKTWIVRDLTPKIDPANPVLLNWPETSLVRGGEFQFTPVLVGEGKLSAKLLGTKETTPLKIENQSVSFQVAANELASLLLLKLTVTGPHGSATYPIPIRIQGPPMPFVWPDLNPGPDADSFAAGFKSLTRSKANREALDSTFYESPVAITEVYGPIEGYLALLTEAKRIEFLSLETKKIVKSISVSSDKVKYYAGGGALFEYDARNSALTRISVPDGQHGATFKVPPGCELQALALGAERTQPLTLFLERRQDVRSEALGDFTVTTWHSNRTIVALNSETFRGGPWQQPQIWTPQPSPTAFNEALDSLGVNNEFPKRVVGSRDGFVLVLPKHLLVISPRYSLAVPFPAAKVQTSSGPYTSRRATGSITGLIAASDEGVIYENGSETTPNDWSTASACGRYQFGRIDGFAQNGASMEIRALEGQRPLFRLNRIVALKVDRDEPLASLAKAWLLQDGGPLLVRSKGGHLLQFIDFDIPRIARELSPENFHVISQPMPCVVEGGAYEYQIKVNNPGLVTAYKLHDPPPNAAVSSAGLLHYSAPQGIQKPEQVDFTIELLGKSGPSVLHHFPLIVLPRALAVPLPK